MMQVQVNMEDISPEEFLEGNGWCTIRYKTQSNRETAQSNTQNGAHSHTGEGANGNRQRSRQQQRNVKQQVIRNSKIAYETAPDYTVKGIIRRIPLEEDAKSIHTNIIHGRNPHAVAAKRLSNTKTVIVAFEGPRVPSYVRAAEEAEEAAKATSSAAKSRLRSRTHSRGRSRSQSRTPDSRKQRRLRSRTPRRIATRDTETIEKVSWADAVSVKRAPTAKAGDKTPAKTETKIAKLTQEIKALQKQIEHMQTQIRAKDELIEQLQHAVKSGTDTEAMQETQEELIGADEVVCPDTINADALPHRPRRKHKKNP
ncbi:hypothetical protein HPB49_025114 [Dermacentor silvarum]|uniref:Uncharacterized protein n=1 Tax=Dermacentor silvarum TaxID=543639 RepID=A0ACB8E3W9_DERSI|nr:hypothetical protein HPB49_025114 [Dermacentor silvarum]